MTLIRSFFAAIMLCGLPALLSADTIMVKDAYAYRATPSSKAGGIFMMIHNHTGAEDRLLEVRSDAAKMVQLHTHLKDEDGVMKMRHVPDGFDIPAHGMRSLKRGGDHLMFMGLVAPWEHGGAIQLTLVFENAGEMMIEVPIDLERKDMAHSH